ncbi:hypothetical protein BLNAU_3351 [Blattamonas nauphoetae]|uniref:Uncharacterized protein n=1 Tax=Blattamonas nauphoetae TaxID=2049346 RepID=A0ABQ9YCY1_9EUKA|nr:hypothetical protein BLNAU_3351 [Blattamonas nauphoetae]
MPLHLSTLSIFISDRPSQDISILITNVFSSMIPNQMLSFLKHTHSLTTLTTSFNFQTQLSSLHMPQSPGSNTQLPSPFTRSRANSTGVTDRDEQGHLPPLSDSLCQRKNPNVKTNVEKLGKMARESGMIFATPTFSFTVLQSGRLFRPVSDTIVLGLVEAMTCLNDHQSSGDRPISTTEFPKLGESLGRRGSLKQSTRSGASNKMKKAAKILSDVSRTKISRVQMMPHQSQEDTERWKLSKISPLNTDSTADLLPRDVLGSQTGKSDENVPALFASSSVSPSHLDVATLSSAHQLASPFCMFSPSISVQTILSCAPQSFTQIYHAEQLLSKQMATNKVPSSTLLNASSIGSGVIDAQEWIYLLDSMEKKAEQRKESVERRKQRKQDKSIKHSTSLLQTEPSFSSLSQARTFKIASSMHLYLCSPFTFISIPTTRTELETIISSLSHLSLNSSSFKDHNNYGPSQAPYFQHSISRTMSVRTKSEPILSACALRPHTISLQRTRLNTDTTFTLNMNDSSFDFHKNQILSIRAFFTPNSTLDLLLANHPESSVTISRRRLMTSQFTSYPVLQCLHPLVPLLNENLFSIQHNLRSLISTCDLLAIPAPPAVHEFEESIEERNHRKGTEDLFHHLQTALSLGQTEIECDISGSPDIWNNDRGESEKNLIDEDIALFSDISAAPSDNLPFHFESNETDRTLVAVLALVGEMVAQPSMKVEKTDVAEVLLMLAQQPHQPPQPFSHLTQRLDLASDEAWHALRRMATGQYQSIVKRKKIDEKNDLHISRSLLNTSSTFTLPHITQYKNPFSGVTGFAIDRSAKNASRRRPLATNSTHKPSLTLPVRRNAVTFDDPILSILHLKLVFLNEQTIPLSRFQLESVLQTLKLLNSCIPRLLTPIFVVSVLSALGQDLISLRRLIVMMLERIKKSPRMNGEDLIHYFCEKEGQLFWEVIIAFISVVTSLSMNCNDVFSVFVLLTLILGPPTELLVQAVDTPTERTKKTNTPKHDMDSLLACLIRISLHPSSLTQPNEKSTQSTSRVFPQHFLNNLSDRQEPPTFVFLSLVHCVIFLLHLLSSLVDKDSDVNESTILDCIRVPCPTKKQTTTSSSSSPSPISNQNSVSSDENTLTLTDRAWSTLDTLFNPLSGHFSVLLNPPITSSSQSFLNTVFLLHHPTGQAVHPQISLDILSIYTELLSIPNNPFIKSPDYLFGLSIFVSNKFHAIIATLLRPVDPSFDPSFSYLISKSSITTQTDSFSAYRPRSQSVMGMTSSQDQLIPPPPNPSQLHVTLHIQFMILNELIRIITCFSLHNSECLVNGPISMTVILLAVLNFLDHEHTTQKSPKTEDIDVSFVNGMWDSPLTLFSSPLRQLNTVQIQPERIFRRRQSSSNIDNPPKSSNHDRQVLSDSREFNSRPSSPNQSLMSEESEISSLSQFSHFESRDQSPFTSNRVASRKQLSVTNKRDQKTPSGCVLPVPPFHCLPYTRPTLADLPKVQKEQRMIVSYPLSPKSDSETDQKSPKDEASMSGYSRYMTETTTEEYGVKTPHSPSPRKFKIDERTPNQSHQELISLDSSVMTFSPHTKTYLNPPSTAYSSIASQQGSSISLDRVSTSISHGPSATSSEQITPQISTAPVVKQKPSGYFDGLQSSALPPLSPVVKGRNNQGDQKPASERFPLSLPSQFHPQLPNQAFPPPHTSFLLPPQSPSPTPPLSPSPSLTPNFSKTPHSLQSNHTQNTAETSTEIWKMIPSPFAPAHPSLSRQISHSKSGGIERTGSVESISMDNTSPTQSLLHPVLSAGITHSHTDSEEPSPLPHNQTIHPLGNSTTVQESKSADLTQSTSSNTYSTLTHLPSIGTLENTSNGSSIVQVQGSSANTAERESTQPTSSSITHTDLAHSSHSSFNVRRALHQLSQQGQQPDTENISSFSLSEDTAEENHPIPASKFQLGPMMSQDTISSYLASLTSDAAFQSELHPVSHHPRPLHISVSHLEEQERITSPSPSMVSVTMTHDEAGLQQMHDDVQKVLESRVYHTPLLKQHSLTSLDFQLTESVATSMNLTHYDLSSSHSNTHFRNMPRRTGSFAELHPRSLPQIAPAPPSPTRGIRNRSQTDNVFPGFTPTIIPVVDFDSNPSAITPIRNMRSNSGSFERLPSRLNPSQVYPPFVPTALQLPLPYPFVQSSPTDDSGTMSRTSSSTLAKSDPPSLGKPQTGSLSRPDGLPPLLPQPSTSVTPRSEAEVTTRLKGGMLGGPSEEGVTEREDGDEHVPNDGISEVDFGGNDSYGEEEETYDEDSEEGDETATFGEEESEQSSVETKDSWGVLECDFDPITEGKHSAAVPGLFLPANILKGAARVGSKAKLTSATSQHAFPNLSPSPLQLVMNKGDIEQTSSTISDSMQTATDTQSATGTYSPSITFDSPGRHEGSRMEESLELLQQRFQVSPDAVFLKSVHHFPDTNSEKEGDMVITFQPARSTPQSVFPVPHHSNSSPALTPPSTEQPIPKMTQTHDVVRRDNQNQNQSVTLVQPSAVPPTQKRAEFTPLPNPRHTRSFTTGESPFGGPSSLLQGVITSQTTLSPLPEPGSDDDQDDDGDNIPMAGFNASLNSNVSRAHTTLSSVQSGKAPHSIFSNLTHQPSSTSHISSSTGGPSSVSHTISSNSNHTGLIGLGGSHISATTSSSDRPPRVAPLSLSQHVASSPQTKPATNFNPPRRASISGSVKSTAKHLLSTRSDQISAKMPHTNTALPQSFPRDTSWLKSPSQETQPSLRDFWMERDRLMSPLSWNEEIHVNMLVFLLSAMINDEGGFVMSFSDPPTLPHTMRTICSHLTHPNNRRVLNSLTIAFGVCSGKKGKLLSILLKLSLPTLFSPVGLTNLTKIYENSLFVSSRAWLDEPKFTQIITTITAPFDSFPRSHLDAPRFNQIPHFPSLLLTSQQTSRLQPSVFIRTFTIPSSALLSHIPSFLKSIRLHTQLQANPALHVLPLIDCGVGGDTLHILSAPHTSTLLQWRLCLLQHEERTSNLMHLCQTRPTQTGNPPLVLPLLCTHLDYNFVMMNHTPPTQSIRLPEMVDLILRVFLAVLDAVEFVAAHSIIDHDLDLHRISLLQNDSNTLQLLQSLAASPPSPTDSPCGCDRTVPSPQPSNLFLQNTFTSDPLFWVPPFSLYRHTAVLTCLVDAEQTHTHSLLPLLPSNPTSISSFASSLSTLSTTIPLPFTVSIREFRSPIQIKSSSPDHFSRPARHPTSLPFLPFMLYELLCGCPLNASHQHNHPPRDLRFASEPSDELMTLDEKRRLLDTGENKLIQLLMDISTESNKPHPNLVEMKKAVIQLLAERHHALHSS